MLIKMLLKGLAAVTLLAQSAVAATAAASGYKNMVYYAYWYFDLFVSPELC